MITETKPFAGIRQLLARPAPAAPAARPRRLRQTPALRAMVRETRLASDDFIYPLFVRHGRNQSTPIASMPGVFQWSPDQLAREAESIAELGIPAVLLFGLWPAPITNVMESSVKHLVEQILISKIPADPHSA